LVYLLRLALLPRLIGRLRGSFAWIEADELKRRLEHGEAVPELETAVLAVFPDALTRADHLARMDRRIDAKDFSAATRAAKRVGPDQVAIPSIIRQSQCELAEMGCSFC
jgi:hypothetical protein